MRGLRHRDHEVTEIAGAVVFIELEFGEELPVVADFRLIDCVVAVPESAIFSSSGRGLVSMRLATNKRRRLVSSTLARSQ